MEDHERIKNRKKMKNGKTWKKKTWPSSKVQNDRIDHQGKKLHEKMKKWKLKAWRNRMKNEMKNIRCGKTWKNERDTGGTAGHRCAGAAGGSGGAAEHGFCTHLPDWRHLSCAQLRTTRHVTHDTDTEHLVHDFPGLSITSSPPLIEPENETHLVQTGQDPCDAEKPVSNPLTLGNAKHRMKNDVEHEKSDLALGRTHFWWRRAYTRIVLPFISRTHMFDWLRGHGPCRGVQRKLWRCLLIYANFGVREGPPAVQLAQEGLPVLGLRVRTLAIREILTQPVRDRNPRTLLGGPPPSSKPESPTKGRDREGLD